MSQKIISPCISICKTDPVTGFCYGCARTNEEKKIWKADDTSDEWKKKSKIISRKNERLAIDAFKESCKIKLKKEFLYTKNII